MTTSRTDRQKECVEKWRKAGGKATLELCTGFGKTRVAGMIVHRYLKSNPNAKVLISVPTEVLKEQWITNLVKWKMLANCTVEIVNSIIKTSTSVDLLIIDEVHRHASQQFVRIFSTVKYKYILALTGTLKRLDGREEYIKKHCPVVDVITVEEAVNNGWLSNYTDYKVLLDVDLTEYLELDRKFNSYFAYFDYDFNLAMNLVKNHNGYRNKYAKRMGLQPKEVTAMCFDWMRMLRARKAFITSHPEKLRIVHKILAAFTDRKCITFSATIADASKIKYGEVLSSKETKAKNRITLEEFTKQDTGVINTAKQLDEGSDISGLSIGIIVSGDSSAIRKRQRLGRVIRKEGDKRAMMFTLIIRGTADEMWYNNSTSSNYTTINEEQLDQVLKGESVETRQRDNEQNFTYRF